ncbi:unnamed protein product, partial [Hydatigera taeniaeformis]|uniref:KH_dom_type_1 domain-containing protein n=1 Tax=Hydatigena taeniaeformis TaxID=6205 RepID=A0A0R3WPM2_HYDTA
MYFEDDRIDGFGHGSKRDGREFDNEVPPKKVQKGDVSNISVRFLIPARAAGLIIGKGGENIKRIRNQVTISSAFLLCS